MLYMIRQGLWQWYRKRLFLLNEHFFSDQFSFNYVDNGRVHYRDLHTAANQSSQVTVVLGGGTYQVISLTVFFSSSICAVSMQRCLEIVLAPLSILIAMKGII